MKEKIKLLVGEELYEVGPAIVTAFFVIVVIVIALVASFPDINFSSFKF